MGMLGVIFERVCDWLYGVRWAVYEHPRLALIVTVVLLLYGLTYVGIELRFWYDHLWVVLNILMLGLAYYLCIGAQYMLYTRREKLKIPWKTLIDESFMLTVPTFLLIGLVAGLFQGPQQLEMLMWLLLLALACFLCTLVMREKLWRLSGFKHNHLKWYEEWGTQVQPALLLWAVITTSFLVLVELLTDGEHSLWAICWLPGLLIAAGTSYLTAYAYGCFQDGKKHRRKMPHST